MSDDGLSPELLDETMRRIVLEVLIRELGEGKNPHGWRCEYPDRYPGYCHCAKDITEDITSALDAYASGLVAAARENAQLQARIDKAKALAETWRYKGEFGWGAWQEGNGPDQEGWTLDQASTELRRVLSGEEA